MQRLASLKQKERACNQSYKKTSTSQLVPISCNLRHNRNNLQPLYKSGGNTGQGRWQCLRWLLAQPGLGTIKLRIKIARNFDCNISFRRRKMGRKNIETVACALNYGNSSLIAIGTRKGLRFFRKLITISTKQHSNHAREGPSFCVKKRPIKK